MDSCNGHCHWVLVHFMHLFHNVQSYYQSVTAQSPAKLFKLSYIVENRNPSVHSEECTIMSDCVGNFGQQWLQLQKVWFVQTLNLFLNFSLFLQLLVTLPLWTTNRLSTRRSLSLATFRHVGQKYRRQPVDGFQQSHVVHIYVDRSCGVTTV